MNETVAIIGSGPYGLAAAAHLRAAHIDAHVFGNPMDFWDTQMPRGMLLRSQWSASHIADPHGRLSLDSYCAAQRLAVPKPIPLGSFIEYGRWFQQQVVPDLDTRRVARLDGSDGHFRLTLEGGDVVTAERVVVAAGISPFASRPPQFDGLPGDRVVHTSQMVDPTSHAGLRTMIVGGGQSALESAALLHEAGVDVEVIVRRPRVTWLDQRAKWLKSEANPIRGLLYPPTDVGPPGLNLIVASPGLFRMLPRALQDPIAHRSIRPAGAAWLVPRVRGVRLTTGRSVLFAKAERREIRVTLSDGTERRVEHVVLATGFRVNLAQYGFLAPSLLSTIRVMNGYPELGRGFESSVPGLHFVGAVAARSFGPLCRFVAGTGYTARSVTAAIVAQPGARWQAIPQGVRASTYRPT
jgi:FAD-dependent urate hydroxylase